MIVPSRHAFACCWITFEAKPLLQKGHVTFSCSSHLRPFLGSMTSLQGSLHCWSPEWSAASSRIMSQQLYQTLPRIQATGVSPLPLHRRLPASDTSHSPE